MSWAVAGPLDDHQVGSRVILVCRTRTILNACCLVEQAWLNSSRYNLLGSCIFKSRPNLISRLTVAVDLYVQHVLVSVICAGGMLFCPAG